MGWSSGSDLFKDLIDSIKTWVPDKEIRGRIYFDMIEAFENKDCDTLYEVLELDPVFDEVFQNFHPEYEEDV